MTKSAAYGLVYVVSSIVVIGMGNEVLVGLVGGVIITSCFAAAVGILRAVL